MVVIRNLAKYVISTFIAFEVNKGFEKNHPFFSFPFDPYLSSMAANDCWQSPPADHDHWPSMDFLLSLLPYII